MLRRNYRYVQSTNISLDVAKCGGNFHQFTQNTHLLSVAKYDLSLLNNLCMVRFQLSEMSSYAKTRYRCVQSSNITVDVAKWGDNFHKFTKYTHSFSVTKNYLSWLNNLIMVRNQLIICPLMIRTNNRWVQSNNISLDVAKCGENFHKITLYTHYLSVTKNALPWVNNLFMVKFQLISMSSYAKNKLQMCSVTQHQCRRCQMCGKFSQIHPVHSLLSVTKNDLSWLNNQDSTH